VERALAWTVKAYFGLAVVHWWSVALVMDTPPAWCGNVITDPLMLLLNKVGPVAGLCVGILLWRGVKRRRRPGLPLWIPPVFFGTLAALINEVIWLLDYGLDLSRSIWWLPGLRSLLIDS
jgi:hypothetical protein